MSPAERLHAYAAFARAAHERAARQAARASELRERADLARERAAAALQRVASGAARRTGKT